MTKQAFLSVETETQLHDYCHNIINNPEITWVAMDTEFVREDTYFPKLSLIQVQDCFGNAAIIDPLKIHASASERDKTSPPPLSALVALLTDPNTLKVFHCARQDIEVLYQLEHKMPVSIFDTQIATLFLKHGEMAGFARVVKEELGITIDKSQTRTNWHARPLTEAQIQYALDDVRYLAPLYEHCLTKLNEEQLNAVTEECLTLLDTALYVLDPKKSGEKVKGIKGYKAKPLAIVYTLAAWREQFAVTHNQPKKWVMNDEVITQMAKRPPQTVEALYKVPHIKSSSVMAHGETWIELIDQVFQQSPNQWPQPAPKQPSPNAQEEAISQLLTGYARQIAIDYRLNLPSLIQHNDILAIVRDQTPQKPLLSGWRYQLLGRDIQAVLRGDKSFKIIQRCIVLV